MATDPRKLIDPTRDRHIRRFKSDYATALSLLLPQGLAWPTDPDSVLQKTTRGLAGVYEYIDDRAADLLEVESDPRITNELLTDWERNWDLPDACMPLPSTDEERRIALVTKMTFLGRQDREFFSELAATLGVEIDIREYSPWMFGVSEFGETQDLEQQYWHWEIASPRIRFYWTVWIGEPSPKMECLINRYKPAFTRAIFNYTRIVVPHLDLKFTTTVPNVTVSFPRIVPQGNLVLSPTAPTVGYTKDISPPQGGLWLQRLAPISYAPTVTLAGRGYPPQGNLAFSSVAPTVGIGKMHIPGAKDLALSTFAPIKLMGGRGFPPQGDLAITTFAPIVSTFKQPDAAQLAFTLSAPTILKPETSLRTPGAGQMLLSTTAPTLVRTTNWVWSNTRKSTSINLSADRLTATLGTGNTHYHNVFADTLVNRTAVPLKRYAEFRITIGAAGSTSSIGMAAGSAPNDDYYIGQDLSIGAWNDGSVWTSSNQIGSWTDSLVNGDILCIAYSGAPADDIWFRRIRGGLVGAWNYDSSANPATGVGAFNTGQLGLSPLLLGITLYLSGEGYTANFGGSAFVGTVPSGFVAWNTP